LKYSKEVYEKTKSVLDSRRIKAETDAEKRRVEFAKVHPELLVIEDELTKTGLEAVKAVIGGSGDVKKTVEELMKTNLQLQKDRENLLLSAGVDKNYLKPHYTCEICKDKGYTDGKIFLNTTGVGIDNHSVSRLLGTGGKCFASVILNCTETTGTKGGNL